MDPTCAIAFSLARSVCFYAKKAIDRKIGSIYEVKSTSQSESYKLPKYEIDSCSTEGSKPTFNKGDISFNNVSFCYPSRKEQMILAKFSLDIKSGTTIAIVGKRQVVLMIHDVIFLLIFKVQFDNYLVVAESLP